MAGMTTATGTRPHVLSWRSRTVRGFALLLALTLATRLVWGWACQRILARQLDEQRRRGWPARLEDIQFAAVADEQNAAVAYANAAAAQVPGVDSPASSILEYPDFPPYPLAWTQLAEASEKAHGKVFALSRKARAMSAVQMRTALSINALMATKLPYNAGRQLANTLGDGALYAHVTGDDAEAIERIEDVLGEARVMRADPTLIGQLVATGIEALAVYRIQVIAPGLRFTQRPELRQPVKRLIAELLDERLAVDGMRQSLIVEGIWTQDLRLGMGKQTWAIRPLAALAAARDGRRAAALVEAVEQPSKPAAVRVMEQEPALREFNLNLQRILQSQGGLTRPSRWFEAGGLGYDRIVETHMRILSDRRVAAVSLAANLYRTDRGDSPARLEDLVPKYLPAVPKDPYYDDRALGYAIFPDRRPDGAARPMVWFDCGPVTDYILPEPMFGFHIDNRPGKTNRDGIRQYRDLSRFAAPATTAPSSQAVDDQDEKADAPRDDAQ